MLRTNKTLLSVDMGDNYDTYKSKLTRQILIKLRRNISRYRDLTGILYNEQFERKLLEMYTDLDSMVSQDPATAKNSRSQSRNKSRSRRIPSTASNKKLKRRRTPMRRSRSRKANESN